MTKNMLLLFWTLWMLDVLFTLLGYREFLNGVFGRYAAPTSKYLALWIGILLAGLLILGVSLYFKNHDRPTAAIAVVLVPLVLALPYALFLGAAMLGGKNNWQ